ncbi:hypothetical protein GCK72_006572 [Caenorhabditis remanei]|uniref:Uncharacterized protein n=1 Tax=Caenorhabditis remanei TaxID=31234 RepID=A0A6A5HJ45_CAERE|nr:hypothetical protein GCK72_006572 [Caenorhabditis remanei]KAF1766614.1 hypothetical protein GCK72_006572 [Caenorhabditis remanei]
MPKFVVIELNDDAETIDLLSYCRRSRASQSEAITRIFIVREPQCQRRRLNIVHQNKKFIGMEPTTAIRNTLDVIIDEHRKALIMKYSNLGIRNTVGLL